MDDLLKTIRLSDDIKLEIYQQGKRRKYSIFLIPVNGIYSNDNYFKTTKYDISLNEDDIIDESIKQFSIYTKKDKEYYKILQNPWDNNSPSRRRYGSTLYYLNNGCSISIGWLESGINKYSDNDDANIDVKKIVNIYLPKGFTENNGIGYLSVNKSSRLDYSTNVGVNYMEHFNQSDSDLIKFYISIFKTMVANTHGDKDYELKLCDDDTKSCSIIEYKSPIQIPKTTTQPTITNISATQSNSKLTIVGLPEIITIKAKSDISFEVFIGDIIEKYELEDEFVESDFNGEEESPLDIPEVSNSYDSVEDNSYIDSYNPNYSSGIIELPKNYSHTKSQGYNILNGKWIGDLILSAKSHIGHPTYDIEGTDNGSLGCASAVSMIFYRAFGVSIKDGRPVQNIPRSIDNFGSKGTSTLGSYFNNSSLYRKINWSQAQPGDIINTARGNKAGHIGVVVDVRSSDGSWSIISNSSKGFSGGGGGAIKMNYSVKKWQSVANRNPSQTFAFRYIGPKLTTA